MKTVAWNLNVKTSTRKEIRYVIKKGNHSSVRFVKRSVLSFAFWRRLVSNLPFMLIKGKFSKLQALINIPTDNWHSNPDTGNVDWLDVNKLVGVNFGLFSSPHKNSFRIGWVNNYETPYYSDLFLYYYEEGQRTIVNIGQPICTIQLGKDFEVTMQVGPNDSMYVNIWQGENELFQQTIPANLPNKQDLFESDDILFTVPDSKYFSVLEPYHGGQMKAPKKLEFFFKTLQITYQ